MSAPPSKPEISAGFVSLLTNHQGDLWAFIVSLMPGHPDVGDVLQKTNLVLWNKQAQFEPGTNFRAWAFQIARFEMLNHLRSCRRDGWVPMNDELAATIAAEMPENLDPCQARLDALECCLSGLRKQDRRLIEHRYRTGTQLDEFARASGRSVSALSVTLFRLRAALRRCVEERLHPKGGPA